ncbi:ADP-ribosylation factor-like protein 13B [Anabrus simplex]|uniref:ADP-ribosylation factor-like protein 13B n=1 Tax=Anabrus simplex TaxID=316456 RepID=UPI0035A2902E
MGNCCHFLKPRRNVAPSEFQKKIVLLLVGLDNAGKTSAAKGLIGEAVDTVVPTVGFSSVSLRYRKYAVTIYDLGGGSQIRGIWHRYFCDVHGIIFVVDASDLLRLEECRKVLESILTHEKLRGKPVLLLANKQDREGALDELDIVEKLDVERLVNEQRCPTMVETCSATAAKNSRRKVDPAIHNGYKWLLNCIIRDFEVLSARVEADIAEQQLVLEREKAERLERVLKAREERKGSGDDTLCEETDFTHDPFRPIAEVANGSIHQNGKAVLHNSPVVTGKESPRKESQRPTDSPKQTENTNQLQCVDVDDNECHPGVTKLIKEQLELEAMHQKKKAAFLRRSNKTGPAPLMSSNTESSDIPVLPTNGLTKHLPPLRRASGSIERVPWTRTPLNAGRLSLDAAAWDLDKSLEVVTTTNTEQTTEQVPSDDGVT